MLGAPSRDEIATWYWQSFTPSISTFSAGISLRLVIFIRPSLDNCSFLPSSVEFTIENLLPRPQVKFPVGHRHDDLMMHEDVFEMTIGVRFARAMVLVVLAERRKCFEPLIDVTPDAGLVVVNSNAGGDVHRRREHHAFADPTLAHGLLNLVRDDDVLAVVLSVEPEVFRVKLHAGTACRAGRALHSITATNAATNSASPINVPRKNGSAITKHCHSPAAVFGYMSVSAQCAK